MKTKELKKKMELAAEWVRFCDDKLPIPRYLRGKRFVQWVDRRKVAYLEMMQYWYEYGVQKVRRHDDNG